VWKRNLLRSLLGTQLEVAAPVWQRPAVAWIVFFVLPGAVNLVVAYLVPTDTWVNFKLFGLFGMTMVFTLGDRFLPRAAHEGSARWLSARSARCAIDSRYWRRSS
jgi:intracellular septation protein A